ncbi:MAG: hypothetical protein JO345_08835 [Streptosporangiaceae bacterium]|nr:hypothetical protein [Streptosporangiaceae bacterium]
MDLESRVTAVEEGLAAVREKELPALRAETRGWAEIAVKAASRADAAAEIINLIYQDVRETKSDAADIKTVQEEHGRRLDGIDVRLDGIDGRLDTQGEQLAEHGEMLQKILAKLS